MYEKETDSKIDELTSLVKAMDMKLRFIMDDLEELKAAVTGIGETVVQTAISINTQSDRTTAESARAEKLNSFREQTQRW